MPLRIGIIGGTGVYSLGRAEEIEVDTPHGAVLLHRGTLGARETFFLPRHGPAHEVPAHRVSHAANIDALRAAHCDYVIGVNNVGALRSDLKPGTWAVVEDFLDFHRAPITRYGDRPVHVDFRAPYCPTATRALERGEGLPLPRVVYAGVDGPRFETRAEVARLARSGASVVGMTGVPEAVLAHEAGLCYAALAFIGNSATGVGGRFDAQQIQGRLRREQRALLRRLEGAVRRLPAAKDCDCASALRRAELFAGGAR